MGPAPPCHSEFAVVCGRDLQVKANIYLCDCLREDFERRRASDCCCGGGCLRVVEGRRTFRCPVFIGARAA